MTSRAAALACRLPWFTAVKSRRHGVLVEPLPMGSAGVPFVCACVFLQQLAWISVLAMCQRWWLLLFGRGHSRGQPCRMQCVPVCVYGSAMFGCAALSGCAPAQQHTLNEHKCAAAQLFSLSLAAVAPRGLFGGSIWRLVAHLQCCVPKPVSGPASFPLFIVILRVCVCVCALGIALSCFVCGARGVRVCVVAALVALLPNNLTGVASLFSLLF